MYMYMYDAWRTYHHFLFCSFIGVGRGGSIPFVYIILRKWPFLLFQRRAYTAILIRSSVLWVGAAISQEGSPPPFPPYIGGYS